jgi:hypothetical protein
LHHRDFSYRPFCDCLVGSKGKRTWRPKVLDFKKLDEKGRQ